eukprot:g73237.t1
MTGKRTGTKTSSNYCTTNNAHMRLGIVLARPAPQLQPARYIHLPDGRALLDSSFRGQDLRKGGHEPRLIGSGDKGREFDPVWRLNVPIFKSGRKKASSYIEAYMVDIQ